MVTNFNDELQQYSILMNNETFMHFLARLCGLAQTTFEYEGLPVEIDTEAMERFLLFHTAICFARDDVLDMPVALPVVPTGKYDMYGRLTDRKLFSPYDSYNLEASPENSVVMYDNINRMSIMPDLINYAKRLTDILRGIDVNVSHQKNPYIFATSPQGKKTLEAVYKKIQANVPVVYGDTNLQMSEIKVLPTPTPYISEQMWDLLICEWNDALTFLGVQNTASASKRERLITSEVEGNSAQISYHLRLRLNPRKKAIKELNRLWGINASVKVAETELIDIKEVNNNDEPMETGENNISEA